MLMVQGKALGRAMSKSGFNPRCDSLSRPAEQTRVTDNNTLQLMVPQSLPQPLRSVSMCDTALQSRWRYRSLLHGASQYSRGGHSQADGWTVETDSEHSRQTGAGRYIYSHSYNDSYSFTAKLPAQLRQLRQLHGCYGRLPAANEAHHSDIACERLEGSGLQRG